MQQTLFAFLAALLLSMFALSQQRALFFSYDDAYEREIQMAATGLAQQTLSDAGKMAFDECFTDDTCSSMDLANLTDADELGAPDAERAWLHHTGPGPFDLRKFDQDFTDIDDYDGYEENSQPYDLNEETFTFGMEVTVTYADPATGEALPSTTAPTTAKRVTVRVTDTIDDKLYASLSRVYTLAGFTLP